MSEATYVAYAAAYDNVADAEADFATLKQAGLRHITAAIVAKDDKGRVHVHEKTYAGKAAGAAGVVGGVVLGAIFPPAGIAVLTDAAVGGVALGTIGHFAGGLSRHDLKQLGDLMENGQAAVLAVAEDAVTTDVDSALSHAAKKAQAKLDDGDVDAALAELEKGIDKAADSAVSDVS
jgi:uncharacterized membrane protein